jgi:hypothetical protein
MKKTPRIPTLIAIFFLLLATVAGAILIKNRSRWLTGANPQSAPKNVKVTNLTENSFTVSWISDAQVTGLLQYGPEENLALTAKDDRDQLSGQEGSFSTHHVTVKNLQPSIKYYFKIISGGAVFDDNGQLYKITTGPLISSPLPVNDVAYGTVLDQSGSPVEEAIVYLTLAGNSLLSTLTTASGKWVIPLNLARTSDLSSWATYDKEASLEEIFVQAGLLGTATAVAATKYDNPLPAISLGQNHDFRQPSPAESEPENPVPTLPSSSGFSSEALPPPETSLTVINPSVGEELNTSLPEVFGTGPAGETLNLVIESSTPLSGQLTIGADGAWRWTPPAGLTPGEHTLTVSLRDGRKIIRSFTVLAADSGEPNFTATPSATLAPTATSTPTLTPTPSLGVTPTSSAAATPTTAGRVSAPSTDSGVPRSGNLLPTLGIIVLGIIFLFSGQLIFRLKV